MRIFDCDLPRYSDYSSSKLPSYVKDSCGRKNFCFAHGTKEFCKEPFCPNDFTKERKMCSRGPCKAFSRDGDLIQEANRICHSKPVKAIKTIRITTISPFLEFFNEFDFSQNFKFVLLIRDPRGMLNSRLRISRVQKHEKDKGAEISKKVIKICNQIVENIKTITSSHFMHSRTIILRYEDVALDPKNYAKKIYEKFNLDFTKNIDSWIDENTHLDGKTSKMNFYDTHRESAKIAFDWRNAHSNRKMPYEFLQPLQTGCAEMLSLTGYNVFLQRKKYVFYLFEPLILAGIETGAEDVKKELLMRIFDCDLPRYSDYSSSKLPSYVKDSCGRKNFCFAHGTKEFCKEPFCPNDFTKERKMCSRGPCKAFSRDGDLIQEANRICHSKPVKAIKTIRITTISPFLEFFNEFDFSQNFKFVLLIRDPRGMLNSRLRISRVQKHEKDKGAEISKKVIKICNQIVENIKTITSSHFMHSRTIILRYEDVALDPKNYAKKIYEKFNLDFTKNIDSWIDENTHLDGKTSKMNFYDTHRESAKIAFDWRNAHSNRKMPYEFLQPLQTGCAEMLSLTGYNVFSSKEEMYNDTLQPLVPNESIDFLLHL
ncbi:Oidioi.mRNA.OKI2018_I69.chr2.g4938.t1.cds [Oikopleura dioica]|uniref:Sulfotransferase n=1 Tax=Oikopleura dioica TaxID=34765 RepID=A0ABN7SYH4_OIKDI|nr:Oidioi.mRNA.OKI2018_I69.chr2.g4938.t1.cds [Oikopleura dioica]